ncbi:glycine oxidase ThiO [Phytoactinopolyspora alkaliphila]|uniref:glycine oxidase n=1 Tax=Phytoactinopolyspora alkaliphila TaxID=1783498 RepID=A0A6N9YKT7_9ACTN|nr:glycine oxidase ThiO [Phytoactinopolyspora alkaliphila]NED95656.1 glycine oxidase ThiO [Phytoactinopolyspora alkaliphila]
MSNGGSLDVVIAGCGIIGASIAWRLAQAGRTVRCLDPAPGDGSTRAAAGMLAAVTESTFGEHEVMRLNVASSAMWADFAAELETETGMPTGYHPVGTLTVAFDAGDRQQLRRLLDLQQAWGLDAHAIDVAEARRREPSLGPRIAGAVWAPGDHQVNPRAVLRALHTALRLRGVEIVRHRATRLVDHQGGAVVGVEDDTGTRHEAALVVLAAGWHSRDIALSDPLATLPIRPVKGQVIRLDGEYQPSFHLNHVVRGFVQSRPVYVVPRADGEIVVGATSEEQPDNRLVTAGGIFALLRDARALVPGLDELPVTETTARARPGTPDNVPLIGRFGASGAVAATGHYRNGILLAPLTAAAVATYCRDGVFPDSVASAAPSRFREAAAEVVAG